jgi:hypothetical protein
LRDERQKTATSARIIPVIAIICAMVSLKPSVKELGILLVKAYQSWQGWDTEGLDEEVSCSVDGGYGVLLEYRLGDSWSILVDQDGVVGIVLRSSTRNNPRRMGGDLCRTEKSRNSPPVNSTK